MPEDWLRLLYTRSLTSSAKRQLVEQFGSPRAVFTASARQLKTIQGISESVALEIQQPAPAVKAAVRSDLELLRNSGAEYIGFCDPAFPKLLNQIPDPPLGLFVLGDARLMQLPQVAVVGSRSASPAGLASAREFARGFGDAGLIVTSGMASGVDSAAHLGCLEAGAPTIAVMGTGIDRIYPASNRRLFQRISQSGAVITEFPPGTQARRQHFPRRNRVISGLSLGTVVVEAGIRSGSLITARLAAEQGRDVFALPGPIRLPTSRGCHKLIREGATLVENPGDVLEELRWGAKLLMAESPPTRPLSLSEDENLIYNLIDYAPIGIDQLIDQSRLTPARVSAILVALELSGAIVETGSGYQKI